MECNWCERETDNAMILEKNGCGALVWNAYCDKCLSAIEEAHERIAVDSDFCTKVVNLVTSLHNS